MDPVSRQALRNTVRELANEGAAVLLSSHILSELEDMCTMVGMMSKGILVDSGKISDVISRRSSEERNLVISSLGNPMPLYEFLNNKNGINQIITSNEDIIFTFKGKDNEQAHLLKEIIEAGFLIKELQERKKSIEQILLEIDSNTTIQEQEQNQ
jgi:ABC-2 type transport system ATP-binding protein